MSVPFDGKIGWYRGVFGFVPFGAGLFSSPKTNLRKGIQYERET